MASSLIQKWELGPWDRLQYQLLRHFWPFMESPDTPPPPPGTTRIRMIFGEECAGQVAGKTVIDFGCGRGHESVELAQAGAKRVIGLDIVDRYLEEAENRASRNGVSHVCEFKRATSEQADIVISIDAFEHFGEPENILKLMSRLCKPDGEIWIHFGPPWRHPLGGHIFAVFPWAHLLFSESALCRWRADFKADGAHRFSEVEGGLNQMTLKRFEQLVKTTDLRIMKSEGIPIGATRRVYCRPLREFLTSAARYRLRH